MLAVVGPTASGKSSVAVEIAKKNNGIIINGDPFQAFRDIPIGTGQPSIDEQHEIPHIGYGELPLEYILNPSSFGALVRDRLDSAQKTNRIPILVTGSGLYLKGIWNQLDNLPDVPRKTVEKAHGLCHRLGSPALHRYLNSVDPIRASQLHPNDGSRIQRAIALHIATGACPSKLLSGQNRIVPQNWQVLLVLPQREAMRDRIARRVKNMIRAGWQNEVRQIKQAGLVQHLRRLRPLGYDVWLDDPDPETAEQKIVQATQAYAKRQVTWFRNQLPESVLKLDPDDEIGSISKLRNAILI
ncbi:MAG: tRNA (adenosine(37)-N6)-dimethylallyltransferase MiaA [Holophagales bacterium]|nr:tRNA (adenosine(37)-N6)-dimethylallyltransferase MiaA [Holophagales bacterium]